jgi:serine/threonine-protein kinase
VWIFHAQTKNKRIKKMKAGDRILDYFVERMLGEGGMGTVYHARHTVLDQEVAIKILDPEVARKPGVKERFIQEANIQAKLRHPHIVQVLTATHINESIPALIMDYVDGKSLSEVLELRGALPVEDALKIMEQVLSAVGYAHRQGVIHRDLKPSNVMVMGSGEAKVTDFGIAKVLGSSKFTRTGTAMGSAHYMSPEQIRRPETVDARSDIYSLGCVFYEVLTGRPPFGEKDTSGTESDYEVKTAHVTEAAPALETVKSSIPAWLAKLVMSMLEKEPDQRPSSCEAIVEKFKAGDSLERVREEKTTFTSSRERLEENRRKFREIRERLEENRSKIRTIRERTAGEQKQDQDKPQIDEATGSTGKSVDKAFNQGALIIVVAIIFVASIFVFKGDKKSSGQQDSVPIENPAAPAEQASNTITEQATLLTWKIEAGNPNNLAPCPKDQNSRHHNCWGTYNWANGEKYVGEWRDTKVHGQGTYTWADGEKVVGEFKNGSPEGLVTRTFGNGNSYVGEEKYGNKNGHGTFKWADGNKYVGEWKDDNMNGKGIRYGLGGNIQESGIYQNGTLIKSE